MVNHTRTLLCNLDTAAAGIESGLAGACYIPAGFAPFDTPVVARYRKLFGFMTARDASVRIAALNTLAPILHGPGLRDWALRHDSRLTYTPTALAGDRAVLAGLVAELERHENSALLASLQQEKVVAGYELAPLLASNDKLTRLGATLLAYVDVHQQERDKTWRQ